MTDTTDIAALREVCEILNDHGYLTKSGKIRSSNLAEAVRMIIEQSVGCAEQLEAERQRCAEITEQYVDRTIALSFATQRAEAAEAELAALKGEQVPVEYQIYYHNHGTGGGEWCRIRTKKRYEELQREHAGDYDFSFRMLFTAPQKPNVLLGHIKISEVVAAVSSDQNRKWNGRVGYMAGWNACIDAAIEAADGWVSASDERLMQDMSGIVKDGE